VKINVTEVQRNFWWSVCHSGTEFSSVKWWCLIRRKYRDISDELAVFLEVCCLLGCNDVRSSRSSVKFWRIHYVHFHNIYYLLFTLCLHDISFDNWASDNAFHQNIGVLLSESPPSNSRS
jgi:hypothetical protein